MLWGVKGGGASGECCSVMFDIWKGTRTYHINKLDHLFVILLAYHKEPAPEIAHFLKTVILATGMLTWRDLGCLFVHGLHNHGGDNEDPVGPHDC